MTELLPCPFCGSAEVEVVKPQKWTEWVVDHVTCHGCNAQAAASAWNTRAESPEVERLIMAAIRKTYLSYAETDGVVVSDADADSENENFKMIAYEVAKEAKP